MLLDLLDLVEWMLTPSLTTFPPSECDWVRIIYGKMGGDVSEIPNDCCEMEGVKCEQGAVTMLRWNQQGLNGCIPAEIEKLTNLKVLYVQEL